MRILIFVFFVVIFFANCDNKPISNPALPLIYTCDSQTVFLAVIFSEKLHSFFPSETFSGYFNQDNHEFLNQEEFISEINAYYNRASDKDSIEKVIHNWCYADSMINAVGSLDDEYPPEAILYETAETKHLVDPFLNYPGRGWYSLSSHELYELSVSFLKYCDSLDSLHRETLLMRLRKTSLDNMKRTDTVADENP